MGNGSTRRQKSGRHMHAPSELLRLAVARCLPVAGARARYISMPWGWPRWTCGGDHTLQHHAIRDTFSARVSTSGLQAEKPSPLSAKPEDGGGQSRTVLFRLWPRAFDSRMGRRAPLAQLTSPRRPGCCLTISRPPSQTGQQLRYGDFKQRSSRMRTRVPLIGRSQGKWRLGFITRGAFSAREY